MDQPHLLRLAKQGNPAAIAALMNSALHSAEIQAQVSLDARCLCISLESSKALSQESILKFVKRGLLNLGTESIDTVEICSRKPEESSFSWVRKFDLEPLVQRVSVDWASPEEPQESVDQAEPSHALDLDDDDRDLDEADPAEKGLPIPAYFRAYSVLFGFAIVVGFMSGGMIAAFISTSHAENQAAAEAENGLGESFRRQTPQEKQEKAENYLKTMNGAQARFYRENKRFATSLEELERSTHLISQSYDYAYKLKVADASRAEIAAVPKEAGLRSYVGVVLVNPSKTDDIVCKAKRSAIESLPVPEFSNTLRCPSRSSQVN